MGVFRTISGAILCALTLVVTVACGSHSAMTATPGVAADFSGNINHPSGSERECIRISSGNSCRGKSRSC